MPMKNPPHPGDLIRTEVIEALGLSVSKAAEILKVRRATLSDLLRGKAALTAKMALRIEKAFGPDMDHLLRMQLAYDVAKTRQQARNIGRSGISRQRPEPVHAPPGYRPSERLPSTSRPNFGADFVPLILTGISAPPPSPLKNGDTALSRNESHRESTILERGTSVRTIP